MPARVFISYSHDGQEHLNVVQLLAGRLRADNIDAYIDQYTEHKPPKSWPQWMEDKIDESDYVLVVCTETYRRRFEGKERKGKGKGAKWEGAIIKLEMYEEELTSDGELRFIPVTVKHQDQAFIPRALRGTTHYDVSNQADYRKLLNRLKGIPTVEIPPLGKAKDRPEISHGRQSSQPPRSRPQSAEDHYAALLTDELGTIRMFGSPDVPNLPVSLMDAFVHLDISMSWKCDQRFDGGMRGHMEERAWNLSPVALMERTQASQRMLLIIGDPGSGKTTLLGYYAMTCLHEDKWQALGFAERPLPLYFPLRETDFDKTGTPKRLAINLANWAQSHELDIDQSQFQQWLRERPTLLLLDGLDEIRDIERRRAVCRWIDQRAKGIRDAFLIVTSRWTGYRKADRIELAYDHIRADIRDFSQEQQEEFIDKWFCAAFLKETRAAGDPVKQWQANQTRKARRQAKEVVGYLFSDENRALQQLAAVPMLLQIIAVIWKERKTLLRSRADLYDAAIKYLLDYRDRIRGMDPLLPAPDAIRVLGPVALWMQDDLHKDEVEREALYALMQDTIDTIDDTVSAESFCINLRDRAGLISDYGQDAYIFRHKSFREYLAGLALIEQVRDDPERMDKIVAHVGDDWWEETLRFFMAGVNDRVFDRFMRSFFRGRRSNDLNSRVQAQLRVLITEARQKRVDALISLLKNRRVRDSKKRYIVDCLRTIGNKQAMAAIRAFEATSKGTAAQAAQDIIAERTVELKGTAKIKTTARGRLSNTFRNPLELNAEYILIPGGSYKYSVDKQTQAVPDLYFARYPVTNKRYRQFIRYLKAEHDEFSAQLPLSRFAEILMEQYAVGGLQDFLGKEYTNWGEKLVSKRDSDRRFGGDDQPVVSITWYGAQVYSGWLAELHRATVKDPDAQPMTFRLPNEVEWEWAAGGGARAYPWGDQKPSATLANYDRHAEGTTPVGQYPDGATPEGLMDMAGNCWEWMENTYGHKDVPEAKALRGGAWYVEKKRLLCSARLGGLPVDWFSNDGFRVVCSQS